VSAVLVGLSAAAAPSPVAQRAAQRALSSVTDAHITKPDAADWLMWRRTLDSWGYSPLDQVDRTNVRRLALVWSRGLAPGIQEGTPLVHDGVMFMPNPMDVVQAIDAATGDTIWEYRRQLPADINTFVPFPAINRNLAIYGNSIIDTSADDFIYALDTATGTLLWETQILDYRQHAAQQTSGPIIARGMAVSGRGCEPKGGPEACVVTAHDARTGKEVWRTRTIPKPGEPGDETWGTVPFESRWHVGTWMVPSYDPELDLIYIGTSVTSPAPKFALGGNAFKHLYHNSTLALRADTGRIAWHYQHVVDHWDLDHPFERLLVDTAVAPGRADVPWINPRVRSGERRRVVTGIPGKTGIVYTLDRQTGEFLWARPTIEQNVVSAIDGATGAVTVNPDSLFTAAGQSKLICPGINGGKNWQAGAYSPLTNTMYYPLQNTCMRVSTQIDRPSLSSLYGFSSRNERVPAGGENVGSIHAVAVETGKTAWKYEQRAATTSLVATGGRLLFGGDANGRFRAFDQDTGRVLWEVNLGSAVTGYPVTYAVGGRQFVAVSTGGSLATGGLNSLTPELRPGSSNTLYIFALPRE
jgi:PQQ-dependent dehydrogenase (methanol/ethanol family)